MKMKRSFYFAMLILGVCSIAASFFFQGKDVKAIAGVLIGVGSGFVGISAISLIEKHIERKNPGREKQAEIDFEDERNTMIRNRAKAKAGDITQWLIIGIAYLTILISAALWVTLLVVVVFLLYHVIGLYLMSKYQKEM